jgi:gluconate 2-dehydrogenase gamma chain
VPEEEKGDLSRRTVLAGAALVPVAAITSAAQQSESALSPAETRILEAFVDRLIPKDELGPGAAESGVAVYINRCLGTYLSAEKASFVQGLAAVDTFARSSHGGAFAELAPARQDEILTALENGSAAGFPNSRAFFGRVRRLTLEGMFGDPYYGGNRNFAGWDLIRYPGPRLAVSPDDQKMGVEIKPYRKSAYGESHGH